MSKVIEMSSIEEESFWIPFRTELQKYLLSKLYQYKPSNNCDSSLECALMNAINGLNHKKIVALVTKYIRSISYSEFWSHINNYRTLYNSESQLWNPFLIKRKQDFTKILRRDNFTFQGDKVSLEILSKAMQLDFIIIRDDGNQFSIQEIPSNNDKVIIIYAQNNTFHCVGYKLGKVLSVFKRKQLPKDIEVLIDDNAFLIQHIKYYISSVSSAVKLNDILHHLEQTLGRTFELQERRNVINLIRILLQNQDFLQKIAK